MHRNIDFCSKTILPGMPRQDENERTTNNLRSEAFDPLRRANFSRVRPELWTMLLVDRQPFRRKTKPGLLGSPTKTSHPECIISIIKLDIALLRSPIAFKQVTAGLNCML